MTEFLTLKQVAQELGVCYESARRMTKRKVKPLRLSPITHRILREDLIKWQRSTLELDESQNN